MDKKGQLYIHNIDNNDVIVYVSESWLAFALENDGIECCHPSKVLNRRIWEFIADKETRHLYALLLHAVRTKQSYMMVPFRCDSPDRRRFMEMTIEPMQDYHIRFKCKMIRIEERDRIDVLDRTAKRSEEHIHMCSFCKNIEISEGTWLPTEDAIKHLDLFGKFPLPGISHGICKSCMDMAMERVKTDLSSGSI